MITELDTLRFVARLCFNRTDNEIWISACGRWFDRQGREIRPGDDPACDALLKPSPFPPRHRFILPETIKREAA